MEGEDPHFSLSSQEIDRMAQRMSRFFRGNGTQKPAQVARDAITAYLSVPAHQRVTTRDIFHALAHGRGKGASHQSGKADLGRLRDQTKAFARRRKHPNRIIAR